MSQKRVKIEKSLVDSSDVPIVSIAERSASLDALLIWAKNLDAASEWMKSAILWPTEKFWSTLIFSEDVRELLSDIMSIIPRSFDPDERARLLFSNDVISSSIRRVHQMALVFFLRIAVYNRDRDPFFTEEEYARLVYERKALPMKVVAQAVAVFAAAEHSTTDDLMVKVMKELIRIEVKYKDDIRDVMGQHTQIVSMMELDASLLVSTFYKSRDAARVRLARLIEQYLFEAVDQMYTMKRFMQTCKKTGLRMEPKKFIKCIPPFVEAVYKSILTELIFDAAMCLEEYPLRRFFRLRTQLESFSASLFLFGLECAPGDQIGSIIQEVLHCERFIFIMDEQRSINDLLVGVSHDQKEHLMYGVESIRESQKRKTAQDLERMGMLENLGDLSTVDPSIQKSIEEICVILTHLSPQYVHLCLRHFGYDQSKTVTALLDRDASLPLSLRRVEGVDLTTRGLPQTMPTINYDYEDCAPERIMSGQAVSMRTKSNEKTMEDGKNKFKGLFSLAPSKSVQPIVPPKKEKLNPLESETMRKLRATVDRLKLRAIGQESLLSDEKSEEKLVPMARSKKYCNTEIFKVPEADKVAMRPFYDKYKFETRDVEEDLYDDEYNDTFEEKAFQVEPLRDDGASTSNKNEKFISSESDLNSSNNRKQHREMIVGTRTGKSMPRGALSGSGRAPSSEQVPQTQEAQTVHGNTSYTGGRERQWKQRHKNENKRRGADRKMNKMGI